LKTDSAALSRSGRDPEHLRHTRIQRRSLVSDRILYIESDPGVEQIKIEKGVKSTKQYLGDIMPSLPLAKTSAPKAFQSQPTD
jgi:hypothetical protein